MDSDILFLARSMKAKPLAKMFELWVVFSAAQIEIKNHRRQVEKPNQLVESQQKAHILIGKGLGALHR